MLFDIFYIDFIYLVKKTFFVIKNQTLGIKNNIFFTHFVKFSRNTKHFDINKTWWYNITNKNINM